LSRLVNVDPDTVTAADVNTILREAARTGPGMYTRTLRRQLRRQGLDAPFLAHDMVAELDGQTSPATAAIARLGPQQRPPVPTDRRRRRAGGNDNPTPSDVDLADTHGP
jgi:hypothetical protein